MFIQTQSPKKPPNLVMITTLTPMNKTTGILGEGKFLIRSYIVSMCLFTLSYSGKRIKSNKKIKVDAAAQKEPSHMNQELVAVRERKVTGDQGETKGVTGYLRHLEGILN